MNKLNTERTPFDDLFREGSRLLHQGKAKEAVPFLDQAYQLQPDNVDVAINLSGAFILVRKFKQAVGILEPLINQGSENAMVWINLGAAYLGNPVLARDQEQMQAISAFEHALAIDPLAPSVAYNIGLIYEDRKETGEAILWFEKAVQANPNDEHARRKIDRLEVSTQSNNDVADTNE